MFFRGESQKTKCLIVSRGPKGKNPYQFLLGETPIEIQDSYCYLGVIFARSGSMKAASKALNDKARGAMFSLIRNMNKHHACRIDNMMDLFDKMVLPIAMYNAEIWGVGLLPQNERNCNYFDNSALTKSMIEGLHTKFLKMILGVHQEATNWAVWSETGRLPIIINIFASIIKYYSHISNSPSRIV